MLNCAFSHLVVHCAHTNHVVGCLRSWCQSLWASPHSASLLCLNSVKGCEGLLATARAGQTGIGHIFSGWQAIVVATALAAVSAAPAAAQPGHFTCSSTQHKPTGKLSTAKFCIPVQPLQHAINCAARAGPVQLRPQIRPPPSAKAFLLVCTDMSSLVPTGQLFASPSCLQHAAMNFPSTKSCKVPVCLQDVGEGFPDPCPPACCSGLPQQQMLALALQHAAVAYPNIRPLPSSMLQWPTPTSDCPCPLVPADHM